MSPPTKPVTALSIAKQNEVNCLSVCVSKGSDFGFIFHATLHKNCNKILPAVNTLSAPRTLSPSAWPQTPAPSNSSQISFLVSSWRHNCLISRRSHYQKDASPKFVRHFGISDLDPEVDGGFLLRQVFWQVRATT